LCNQNQIVCRDEGSSRRSTSFPPFLTASINSSSDMGFDDIRYFKLAPTNRKSSLPGMKLFYLLARFSSSSMIYLFCCRIHSINLLSLRRRVAETKFRLNPDSVISYSSRRRLVLSLYVKISFNMSPRRFPLYLLRGKSNWKARFARVLQV
jgi:hypothetical protein